MTPVCALRLAWVLVFAGQQQTTRAVRQFRRSTLRIRMKSSTIVPVSDADQFDNDVDEDVWDSATAFTMDSLDNGFELDSDGKVNASLTGKGECKLKPGVTCACAHPQHPCLRWNPRKHRCTCSTMESEEKCTAKGGSFCVRPKKCVDNCKLCKESNFCQECNDGFHMIGGQCQDMGMVFAKAHHGVKGNLVLLGSEEVFHGLEMGFKGQIKRWRAEEYVIKEFLYFYKDVFDFIVVVPEQPLPGNMRYAENFHLEGDRSADSKLRSAVILQAPSLKKKTLPLMRELEHEWGVFGDIEKLTPGRLKSVGPNWGMSVMHKRGMLGGFPASAVKCTSGVLGEPSCKQPLLWDFDQGNVKRTDDRVGSYNKFDLLIMGLMTANDMPDEKLIFCQGADKLQGKGVQPVTCKKIRVITAADIEAARHPAKDEIPLKKGETLRTAVVVVMSEPGRVDELLAKPDFADRPDLGWLNKYIGEESGRFRVATDGLASMDFKLTSSDLRPAPSQADAAQAVLDASKDLVEQAGRKVERAVKTIAQAD